MGIFRNRENDKLRIMMIGAHPDDCDFRCGGVALLFSQMGHQVQFVSVSDGSAGHHRMNQTDLAERRKLEAQNVADLAGIDYVILDQKDGEIIANLDARRQLIRCIRRFKPDLILTSRPNDYHADHRQTSLLVQDASYLLIVPNICPETEPMNDMPVIGFFYDRFYNPPFKPDIVIDIDDVIDQKFDMLDCHESQVYEWLPYTNHRLEEVPKDPDERMRWLRTPTLADLDVRQESILLSDSFQEKRSGIFGEARMAETSHLYRDQLIKRYGAAQGHLVQFSEAFQLSEYGFQPDIKLINKLFPF